MSFFGSAPTWRGMTIVILLIASFSASAGLAEDAPRAVHARGAAELPAPSRRHYEDIIFEMAPLQPVKSAAAPAAKRAAETPKQSAAASKPAPAPASKPAPISAPAAPATEPAVAAKRDENARPAEPNIADNAAARVPAASAPKEIQSTVEAPSGAAQAQTADVAAKPAKATAPDWQELSLPAPQAFAPPAPRMKDHPFAAAWIAPADATLAAMALGRSEANIEKDHEPASLDAAAFAALIAAGEKGPVAIRLADRATLWLPAGHVYLDAPRLRARFGAQVGGLDETTLGVVFPETREPSWAAHIDLLEDGYVKDQDGAALDPARLLAAHKEAVGRENPERQRAGLAPLDVEAWVTPPNYDAAKRLLNYCSLAVTPPGQEPGERLVGCSGFTLGRQGALRVRIVSDEADLAKFKDEAPAIADAIGYDHGKAYEDADLKADKIAPYTIAALASGAAPVRAAPAAPTSGAQKLGLFARVAIVLFKFWKIWLIALATIAALARWIRGRKQPSANESAPQPSALQKLAPFFARLIAAIPNRKASSADDAAEPASATGAPKAQPGASAARQVSILSTLAARMRGPSETPRMEQRRLASRVLAGGAEDEQPAAEPQTTLAAAPPVLEVDLVEPGDSIAASRAISAGAALREAS